jgi:hypothetical protein
MPSATDGIIAIKILLIQKATKKDKRITRLDSIRRISIVEKRIWSVAQGLWW